MSDDPMVEQDDPGSRDPSSTTDDAARRLEDLLAEHREPEEAGPQTPEPFDPFAPLPSPGVGKAGEGKHGDQETSHPDEDEEAGDGLPDAPLFALLRNVQQDVGVERIDRIWVFPPRRLQAGETAVVVVSAFPEFDEDRRRVYAAHYTVHEDAREPRLAMDEYGTAPTDRVGRLVEEVVERIKDEPAAAPRSHPIEGSDDRWNTVLHELAAAYLEEAQKNPRLRR